MRANASACSADRAADLLAGEREPDLGVPHHRVLELVAPGAQQLAERLREADAAQRLERLVGAAEVGLGVLDRAAERLELARGAAAARR